MASSAAYNFPNFSHLATIKLDGTNYLSWLSLIAPILCTYDLIGIVDGFELCPSKSLSLDSSSKPCPPKSLSSDSSSEPTINPTYSLWVKNDQFILSWLNASLSESVIPIVYGLYTSRAVWLSLELKFASQSRSRITQLKCQLQTLHQGSKSCTSFISSDKSLAAQLVASSHPIVNDDLIAYIIGGLTLVFNPFITSFSFSTRDKVLSLVDFTAELLSFELLSDNQHQ